MEENNSDMELIVPSDTDAEDGLEECVKNHQPYTSKSSHPTPRHICIMAVTTLTTFAFGSLVGYLVCTKIYTTSCTEPEFSDSVVQRETIFDWSNLTALLRNKLTTDNIENSLSEFSSDSHQAGSVGEDVISENIFRRFSEFGLSTWRDEFFVKVQDHPKGGTNGVTFYGTKFDESGYLAYSGNGSVEGAVLYCYYGQVSDFRNLQDLKVSPKGKIVLVRAGKISFAEKVANAASVNASAVLIYPDPADYSFDEGTDLFGHVHLGCGDPYTPGFPSFNHIQFPAVKSSGLPSIPAQTIRASTAATIMGKMGGLDPPRGWGKGGLQNVTYKLGGDNDVASVEVNNVLIEKRIHNVFGVIKGFIDADRYVVIGAQRDAWGPGYAKSTVGTSLLVELARTISDIISTNGFKPRRSIVFASWSAGEYGAVGATEWLEGYLSSLNMKAFSYISLDGVVTGSSFKASASPLMYDLIQSTLKEVSSPSDPSRTLYSQIAGTNWKSAVMEPMRMVDSAYPFQTFSGIPSVSFRFISGTGEYPFFGTMLDTRKNLDVKTSQNLLVLVKTAGEVAGQMALRLVHDHLLRLNVENYSNIIRAQVAQINKEVYSLQMSNRIPKTLEMQWLMSAMGSYSRASRRLTMLIQNSDLQDSEQCRIINDRIMGVEKDLLSPYVSPRESPFRHILLGSGSHTVGALLSHLAAIKEGSASADINLLKNQFALTTWTIQSCANALAGNVWEMDNQI
ncbi:transferrin receptor protein 1-like [Electrophorus electricus]|uniref:transferrin receptor protein 1-like n=1 Tax=Electrophorus electricus TaxID=8005 RepID=UPI0015D0874B|nr:transferrin receptor protein 1-like [Electrophorus electricus]XP_035383744.1 transferrin receptor protein 1-like [Electrophorus electricus]